jgi:hypothetical protein
MFACRSINVHVMPIVNGDALLFGLLPIHSMFEQYIIYDGIDHMANLLVSIGIFASTSEARKNGFNKSIPNGYTELKFKHFRNVSILKIGE